MSELDKEKLSEELKQARQRIAELESGIIDRGKTPPLDYRTFKAFFESATDSFSIWDSNMKLVYLNDATLTKYYPPGTKRADIIGKHFTELVPGSKESERYEKYLNVLNTGKPIYIEGFTPHPKFGDMHLAIRVFKIDNGLGVITIDITERKRMEDELRESQQRFKALIDNAPDVIFSYDINGKFLSGNKKSEEILGYAQGEMLGKSFAESGLFTAESLAKTAAKLEAYKRGESSEAGEYELISKDGRHLFVEVRGVPIVRKDTSEIIAIARDITERKRMEDDLRESKERLSVLLENAPDIIYSYDLNGRFIYGNKMVRDLLGYSPEELSGKSFAESGLLSEEGLLKAMSMVDKSRRGLATGPDEYELTTRDGSRVYIEARGAPISRGDKIEVLCIAHDTTERKQMEEKLRQSEEKLSLMFSSISDAITVVDLSARIIDVNEAAIRQFECNSKNEALGMNSLDFIAVEDRERAIGEFVNTLKTMRGEMREYKLVTMGGREFAGEITTNVLKDKSGNSAGFICITRDITERKRIEKELKDYRDNLENMVKERTAELSHTHERLKENDEIRRAFADNISDIIYAHDSEGRFLYVNKKCGDLTGYSRDELIGKSIFEIGALPSKHIDFVQWGLNSIHDTDKAGKPYEIDLTTKAGNTVHLEIVSFPVSRKGKTEILGIGRDITERKRLEEELQRKERYFRALTESSADGIMVLNRDGTIRYESQGCLRILGYTAEERIGQSVFGPMHPDDIQAARVAFNRMMSGQPARGELRARHKDGSWHIIETNLNNLLDDPAVQGIVVNLRDVTERKHIEEALRESEEWHRALVETSGRAGIGIAIIQNTGDREAALVSINDFTCEMSGYSREELLNMSFMDLMPPDISGQVLSNYKRRQQNKSIPPSYEMGFMHKDGVRVPILVSVALMQFRGKPATVAFFRDITERKRMEEALRESEEKFSAAFRLSPAGIVLSSVEDGRYIEVSDHCEELSGYKREEAIGHTAVELGIWPDPVERDRLVKKILKEGHIIGEETIMRDRFGRDHDISLSAEIITVNQQRYLLSLSTDITERKRAEEALRESEEKYRGIFDESIATVYVFDNKKNFINANQAGLDLLGYSREELLRMSIPDVDADPVVVLPAHQELLSGGRLINYEHKLRRKDGTIVSVLNNSRPLTDASGNVIGMLSTLIDITKRKQIEEALQESEERLRAFFENVPDILFAHDMAGNFTDMNKKALEVSGYSREDIIGKNILETGILPLDQIEGVISGIQGIENGKSGYPYEVQLAKKNGERITVMAVSFPMKRKGKMEVMGIAHDITKRKAMEEALRASEEKLRAIFEAIGDGIVVSDLNGKLIDMNEADIRLFGYEDKEQLLNRDAFDFVSEQDRPSVLTNMATVLTTGIGKIEQYRFMDRNGVEFDAEACGSVMRDDEGKPKAIVTVIRDISDRKRIEEAQKESEAKYRTLVEQSDQGICILQNGRIVFANKALTKMNGYTLKELYAMSTDELSRMIHPDDRKLYIDRTKMRLEGKKLRPRHEYRVIRKDGTVIWYQTFSKRILYRGQPAIQSMMADITESKQWEDKLQKSRDELSFYLRQINQAQEDERKRIARELHDDTIQEIVALSRQLDNLVDKKVGPDEERRENRRQLEEAQHKVDTILKGIRRFTRDLRPSILDDLGVVPALEWLTNDISEQFKIPIKMSTRGEEQIIPSDAALVMYRIAQESLRNACRHSGATHIQIELKYTSQKVTLMITDNGQGFDLPEDKASLIRRGKLGVAGMYERAQLIGATLSIKSRKNKGTTVTLEVDIK